VLRVTSEDCEKCSIILLGTAEQGPTAWKANSCFRRQDDDALVVKHGDTLKPLMFYTSEGCRRQGGGSLRGGGVRLLLLIASRPGTRDQRGQGWLQGVCTASEGVGDASERVRSWHHHKRGDRSAPSLWVSCEVTVRKDRMWTLPGKNKFLRGSSTPLEHTTCLRAVPVTNMWRDYSP
jgi:hypothetical protein